MSSNGAYARYQSNAGGGDSNPYGQSYSGSGGYGGAAGGGYGSGPAPGYGGASYSAPQYAGAAAPSSGGYNPVS
jgi:hypothetical protein